MVLAWLIGDVGKTLYFVFRSTPAQFYICSCLQVGNHPSTSVLIID